MTTNTTNVHLQDSVSSEPSIQQNNAKLNEAIIFATKCYDGQLYDNCTAPYILRPLERLQILFTMGANTDLLIAGLLYDVLTKTDAAKEEITSKFGQQILSLLQAGSDSTEQNWLQRQTQFLNTLHNAALPFQMVVLADTLATLRNLYQQYQHSADALWQQYATPKEKQAWYYNGIIDCLLPLQELDATANAYQELIECYKDLFVIYKITPTYDKLYQANTFGETYCLTKGNPQWMPVTYRFRQNDIALTRTEAETLEDKWYDFFLNVVENDLSDATYTLSQSPEQTVQLSAYQLTVSKEHTTLAHYHEEDTYQILTQLRLIYGIAAPLEQILQQAFGNVDGAAQFLQFCQQCHQS